MPLMMHVERESHKEKPQVTVTKATVTKATVTKVTVTKANKDQRKNARNVDTVVMANKKHVQPRIKDVTTVTEETTLPQYASRNEIKRQLTKLKNLAMSMKKTLKSQIMKTTCTFILFML